MCMGMFGGGGGSVSYPTLPPLPVEALPTNPPAPPPPKKRKLKAARPRNAERGFLHNYSFTKRQSNRAVPSTVLTSPEGASDPAMARTLLSGRLRKPYEATPY